MWGFLSELFSSFGQCGWNCGSPHLVLHHTWFHCRSSREGFGEQVFHLVNGRQVPVRNAADNIGSYGKFPDGMNTMLQ
jgi:hypothetical protein